jgi:hypothetical protein
MGAGPKMTPAAWRAVKLIWAAPCSLLGLIAACPVLLCGGTAHRARQALEVTPGDNEALGQALARLLPFRAIALGHVIIAVGRPELERLRAHELVHVRQYERWGLVFFPAYAASAIWQVLNGRNAYWNNHFEIEARFLSGE